jgi:hypothetical protein
MPDSKLPQESNATDRERFRQANGIKAVIVFLLATAVVFAVFVTAIPLPVRLFVAATDIAVASALWLVLRQKFSKK